MFQTKAVEKIRTHVLFSLTFSSKVVVSKRQGWKIL